MIFSIQLHSLIMFSINCVYVLFDFHITRIAFCDSNEYFFLHPIQKMAWTKHRSNNLHRVKLKYEFLGDDTFKRDTVFSENSQLFLRIKLRTRFPSDSII